MNKKLLILPLLVWALGAGAQAPDGSGPVIGLQRIALTLQNDTDPKAEVPMEMLGKALVAALVERGFEVVPADADGAANCLASVTAFEEKPAGEEDADREFSMRMKMDIARPGSQLGATARFNTAKYFPEERVAADRKACLEEFFRQAAETGAKNLSFHLPLGVRATSLLGDAFATDNLPGPDGEGIGAVYASMLDGMKEDARFLAHYEARAQEKGRLPRVVPGGLEGYPYGAALTEGALGIFRWLDGSGLFAVDVGEEAIERAWRLLDESTPAERSGSDMPDYFLSGTLRPSPESGRDTWHFSLTLRDFVTGRIVWEGQNVRSRPR